MRKLGGTMDEAEEPTKRLNSEERLLVCAQRPKLWHVVQDASAIAAADSGREGLDFHTG